MPSVRQLLFRGNHVSENANNAWLEDFAQLKREISDHYANLEWAVEHRGLDLKQLSERTETRLRQARHDQKAHEAVESCLSDFRDGHLIIKGSK